jgi:hypothetical protein
MAIASATPGSTALVWCNHCTVPCSASSVGRRYRCVYATQLAMVANDSVGAIYRRSFGRGQAAFDPKHDSVFINLNLVTLAHNEIGLGIMKNAFLTHENGEISFMTYMNAGAEETSLLATQAMYPKRKRVSPVSSPAFSPRLMLSVVCQIFGLRPEASLKAVTINPAKALDLCHTV